MTARENQAETEAWEREKAPSAPHPRDELAAVIRERAIQMAHDRLRREGVATVAYRQVAAGVDAALLCVGAALRGARR